MLPFFLSSLPGSRRVPDVRGEIRLFGKLRNEALRLPYFLEHYRSIGVDRFLFVDNGSTDGTIELLRQFNDCHIFSTDQPMASSEGGSKWIAPLLSAYGTSGWNLIADADELLIYPDCESIPLRRFCEEVEREASNAVPAQLVDMYPLGPINSINYNPGDSFISHCSHFDGEGYREVSSSGEAPVVLGGPRLRLFYPELLDRRFFARARRAVAYKLATGPAARLLPGLKRLRPLSAPMLNKVPLIRWHTGMTLGPAAHSISGASLSCSRLALLHFKFLGDFSRKVREELDRKQYFNGGEEYKRYYKRMSRSSVDFGCELTCEYRGSSQLEDLGLIRRPRPSSGHVEGG